MNAEFRRCNINISFFFFGFCLEGHPALIGRHRPFPVTHQAAERWLHHMQIALDITPEIDADSKIKMMNFFRHELPIFNIFNSLSLGMFVVSLLSKFL